MDRAPAEPEVPRRMIPPPEAEGDLELFGAVVGEKMGLHFSPERRAHLWRAVRNLARESAGADPRKLLASLARGSLSSEMIDRLAPHLTVGETYFFRERRTLEAFRRRVLPLYLDRGSLRVWCAGCSSGEEPY
ncbi:MAG TPA: CheR family methyltransferase, partial [Synergistaceae bacterium]|nr:CheR family methyltransferase [Synergistaceae bacterium]